MPLLEPESVLAPPAGPAVDSPREMALVRARLRRLVVATQAVGDQLALPPLYRRIAETARKLVDAEHVALGVLSTAGAATQLVQLEAEDSSALTMLADVEELERTVSPRHPVHPGNRVPVRLP